MSNNISDEVYNSNFQTLLEKFHQIIKGDPPPDKVKTKLEDLKAEAQTKTLTARQSDAIYVRCMNYLKGEYGSTSREHKVQSRVKEK